MAKKARNVAIAPAADQELRRAGSLATAFLTGTAGLLVEVVGARALAPFFGSSLMVWTAQITATLLFLAIGYEVGGRICRRASPWHLPALMFIAASWLALYPALRSPILGMSSAALGVASGSFLSAIVLFGLPLLCLGAASPVLVSYVDQSRPGAGSAAGSLFFISTLGGLAGGWIAVFVVIPFLSVRLCLVGTGVILALIGAVWSFVRTSPGIGAICLVSATIGLPIAAHRQPDIVYSPKRMPVRLLFSRQSDVGLIRVIDAPADAPIHRALLIDGALQGGISLDTRQPYVEFVDYLDRAGQLYAPQARDALLLGLGAGLLAKRLSERGLRVAAVELDPNVAYAARRFFDLPASVDVRIADARSFLRTHHTQHDLVYLDVFAGENVPWYLITVEAFRDIRSHLRPRGRLAINTITNENATSPGIVRLEASLRAAFPDVAVFLGQGNFGVNNALVVAGAGLDSPSSDGPSSLAALGLRRMPLVNADPSGRAITAGTDDRSDIDYADVAVREKWRQLVIGEFGDDILGD